MMHPTPADQPGTPSPDAPRGHAGSEEILYSIFEFAPDAIILVDGAGRITKANAQAAKMFGYTREELVGSLIEILIPQRFASHHVGYRLGYMKSPHARPMGMGLELFGRRKDGSEFPVDIMLSPLEIGEGPLVLGVVRDATERKRIETQAREAREMYIREIHHRVKNNLQVISSLLFLQSTHTTDEHTLGFLRESQSRVKTIALIHEKLYRSTELSSVDFAEYLRDLTRDLFLAYAVDKGNIAIRMSVEDVRLEIDTAIPCGLIINELVSNVLKHAFPAGTRGEVSIALKHLGERRFLLEVRDDGVGLPEGFDWRRSSSLGLRLVHDLARQLDGAVSVETGGGTTFQITFKELQYKERN